MAKTTFTLNQLAIIYFHVFFPSSLSSFFFFWQTPPAEHFFDYTHGNTCNIFNNLISESEKRFNEAEQAGRQAGN